MNGARNLACGHIRTALRFEHAGVAVVLGGAIADRAVLCDPLARHGESAARFSQLLTSGTDIEVSFGIECEVGGGESPSVRPGFSIRSPSGSIPRLPTTHPTISAEP